jgi:D-3-phosphoglycerate dehydrogenase
MKILIADVFPKQYIEKIKTLSQNVQYEPDLGTDDIHEEIPGFNILVVRSTKVTKAAVQASDVLSLIIRAGSGVNTIDVKACSKKGIFVSNCPGLNASAVAELTFAHMLALDRNIPDCVADLRNGEWNKGKYAGLSMGMKGRRLGLIGYGNIGMEVAKRAFSFDMKVTVYDPFLSTHQIEKTGADYAADVMGVCAVSDIISIHIPLTDASRGMIGEREFAAMKDGAYIINTSRGGIVDEKAFLKASKTKCIRGGFDVFEDEPGSKKCKYTGLLTSSGSVYGTHHIGASTTQAQLAVAEEVHDLLKDYVHGGKIRNCVNLESQSHAKAVIVLRHFDRVGVLAEIFKILKNEQINVEDMENIILHGKETACARIKVDKVVKDLKKISESPVIRAHIISVEMYDMDGAPIK